MGEILKAMAKTGERQKRGGNGSNQHAAKVTPRNITSLDDLGIPRDRAIAAETGLSHVTVGKARKATGNQLPVEPTKRVGRDGKARKLPAVERTP
jgi:hypothetical protein